MERIQTEGLVLRRVNYAEADKVVTVLTPGSGKLSFMAKGVRKPKSKLAAGIELFRINDLTLISGKGQLMILAGARARTVFDKITRDYDVVKVAARTLSLIDKATEDDAPREYYDLARSTLELLNDSQLSATVVEGWMSLHLLNLLGISPNLTIDAAGQPLRSDRRYSLDIQAGTLVAADNGVLDSSAIKAWRVLAVSDSDSVRRVRGLSEAFSSSAPILERFLDYAGP